MGKTLSLVAKLCLICNFLAPAAWPQTGAEWMIDTIAGGLSIGDNGPAVQAQLAYPTGVAVDRVGNVYIADSFNHRIRRVDASGTVSTFAGTGERGYSGDGGPAVQAQLAYPSGVAVDGAGNLYIADTSNNRIRRVDARGIITTAAGTGMSGYSGDGGTAVQAQLSRPGGVAVGSAGNLYIADTSNNRIRRVDTTGTIVTFAGTGATGYAEGGYSGDGGPAVQAQLDGPTDVAVDRAGNLYIADRRNYRIRRVDTNGTITTFAGNGDGGRGGDNGPAVQAQLSLPGGVAVDTAGNVYIANTNSNNTRVVDTTGIITTIAGIGGGGSGTGGFSGDGGPAVAARISGPTGVAVDGAGNLYIADRANHRIRRVDATGIITTIAGIGEFRSDGDNSPALNAELARPFGVAVDGAGNLYIADSNHHRIRRVDAAGTITTIAGSGKQGYSGDDGPAIHAKLSGPTGVAVDGAGNLYIADRLNERIRRVDAAGTITTFAGTGETGYSGDNGPAVRARLDLPFRVAVDGAGILYIADRNNHCIRRVDAAGTITTFAGTGEPGYSGDGGPAVRAQLGLPHGVAVDGAGNLYIADTINDRIRRVDATGTITTVAGTGVRGFSGDSGPAVQARLNFPFGVAADGAGNLYVADSNNHRIRRVDATGTITTIAGTGERGYGGDGGLAALAQMATPAGVAVGTTGNVYVADHLNDRIRVITPSSPPPTTLHPPTDLKATAASSSRIDLSWRDNSDNESGFRVQRQRESSDEWVGAGTTAADVTTFSDMGLLPDTAYRYRVQAFNDASTSAFSNEAMAITTTASGTRSHLFVPVLLTSSGRNNAFFTSELTLTNRGTEEATLHYTYTADRGGGSGTATDSLAPGRQKIQPNAIDYLTGLGIPNSGSGNRIGTLRVEVSGSSEVSVTTRTTTAVPEGRAGLAYPGIAEDEGFQEAVYLCGLRESRQDRSNVAVQNTADSSEGDLTLRVTVYSGDSAAPGRSVVLPDLSLPPGGFHQYNGILNRAGFANGYVKVERVSGTGAYYAYGVINDNFNSDGSFVFPLTGSSLVGASGQTLPVIIETGSFQSELTVTNFSALEKTVDFRFVADAVATGNDTATFSLRLKAGEQRILPNLVDWLRQEGVTGIGPAGRAFVGALFATPAEGDMSGIVIGARTGSPDKRGGQYSLFYNGVPYGAASIESAWIYGLQQNAENRSNLALVNTGEIDDSSSTFEITLYDGSGESQPKTKTVTLGPRRWTQENGILGNISQGYVQVRKVSGNNPFIAYGVINDGGRPGERSGDGAFLLSQE